MKKYRSQALAHIQRAALTMNAEALELWTQAKEAGDDVATALAWDLSQHGYKADSLVRALRALAFKKPVKLPPQPTPPPGQLDADAVPLIHPIPTNARTGQDFIDAIRARRKADLEARVEKGGV